MKMYRQILAGSIGAVLPSLAMSATAQGEIGVYPKPQQVGMAESPGAPVAVLKSPAEYITGKTDAALPAEARSLAARLPEKTFSGAYGISIQPDKVVIVARDARGIFYAKNTLKQIEGIYAKAGKVPAMEILDWPDVEFRGTVEGFYGTPWSHEARKRQLEFYGQHKMNTYIYGPKDDPYHSANWRKPYPEKEAAQISELVKVAKDNHVDFVWAIHPGGSIKWTPEDMGNVIKKFELMYGLGVRSFAVFFDDIGGEGTNPKRQAELLNLIHNEFIKKKGDCTPLIMCPTEYNKGWANPKPGTYLDILGDELDPSIHIMWTGNTVVHDIKAEGQEWVNKRTKRPTYFWFNWPVTDYVKSYLGMGRLYGQMDKAGDSKLVSGVVSNPMDKPEASKVGLFSVADYAWNMEGFDQRSDKTWREGIKQLFPACATEMQTFCDHTSDFSGNTHAYRREESVAIAPAVKALLEEKRQGKGLSKHLYERVADEFKAMDQASRVIPEKAGNADFIREVGPWIEIMGNLGRAGSAALEARLLRGGRAPYADCVVTAVNEFNEMDRRGQEFVKNKQSINVPKVGSLVMTPAVKELTTDAASGLYAFVSGKPAVKAVPSVKGGNLEGMERIVDGNRGSFWHSGHYCQPGDWYAVDFGTQIPVRSVELLMGRNDNDNDYVKAGQLEYSADGVSWKPLGGQTGGRQVAWNGAPVQAKALRYRVIEPMSAGPRTVWTAIREFAVNNPPPPKVVTNIPGFAQLGTQTEAKLIRVAPVLEVIKMEPGQELGIEFATPVKTTWVEVNAENAEIGKWGEVLVELGNSGKLEPLAMQQRGNNFVNTNPPDGIKRVVFRNKSDKPQDAKFSMLKVDVPPADETRMPVALEDGSILASYNCDQPFAVELVNDAHPKAKEVAVVGKAEYSIAALDAQGKWVELGKSAGDKAVSLWKLPAGGAKALKIRSDKAQPGKYLNEVIYK